MRGNEAQLNCKACEISNCCDYRLGQTQRGGIQVHGNNKSEAEIEKAIVAGVGAIVIDSFHEIERVARIAAAHEKIQNVFIRVTPGIEAHTHEFIATAHEDVKFGFSLASGSAWKAIEEIEALKSLKLVGLHSHIGSQIFDALGFGVAAERVISLLAKFRDHYSDQLPELDLGGGYGVAYLPGEESVNIDSVLAQLSSIVIRECASVGIRVPRISIEPGLAIAAPTTTTSQIPSHPLTMLLVYHTNHQL